MHDIAHAAAGAARVPSFDDVLVRGRQRRNRRHGLTAGAAALAVASIVVATQVLGTEGDRAPDLAPSPGPTRITDAPTTDADPTAVVDSPDARVVDAAQAAVGSGTAVVWNDGRRAALTLTNDQFETRTDVAVPMGTAVEPAPDGGFVVVPNRAKQPIRVARGDGSLREVTFSDEVGPVDSGEIAVVDRGAPAVRVVAIDAEAATGHPVALPEGTYAATAFGGRITALVYSESGITYFWSDDGGRSWSQEPLPTGELSTFFVVPAGTSQSHDVLESGDGATLAPVVALHRMPAGGGGWTELAYDGPRLTFDVSDDGGLGAWHCGDPVCFLGDRWSDDRQPVEASGLFRWDGGGVEQVAVDHPEVIDQEDRSVVGQRLNEEGISAYVAGPDGSLVVTIWSEPGEWYDLPSR